MNEELDLKQLEQATFRVANQDGLTEFWMGLMIMAIGIVLANSIFVFQVSVTERIKEKYTYPRIGMVKLKDEKEIPSGVAWIAFAIIMIVALSAAFISTRADYEIVHLIAAWAPLLIGIVFLQPAAYLVERSGLKRYYGFGLTTLVLGVLLFLLPFLHPAERMSAFMFLSGGILTLAGVTSMVRFIRKYPVLEMGDGSHEQEERT
ncbi:MAG: hypothetical protein ACXAAR_09155 [Candidatus Thorarchaeota archaeon]|jgi:hypothetical protein